MIHIDVSLPGIHRELECLCDENLEAAEFIREILGQVNGGTYGQGRTSKEELLEDQFCLCDLTRGIILNKQGTLSQNKVVSGHRLMLI